MRRLVITDNLIVDTPIDTTTQEPTNPPGAISLAHLSADVEVSRNTIVGGMSNGIVLRRFDFWESSTAPAPYTVTLVENCITPRAEGFYGLYRKEARPAAADLVIVDNDYDSTQDDWAVDPLEVQLADYADDNNASYSGDCDE